MKPLFLLSVDVDDEALGLPPTKSDRHLKERRKDLELYCVEQGERVRIRPVLPQAWNHLDAYLKEIGCPPTVVNAVLERFRTLRGGYNKGLGSCIAANIFEEEFMEIFVIEPGGRVTKLMMYFDDE